MTDWYSTATDEEEERLIESWPAAPTDAPELCAMILGTARDQVIAFAPLAAFEVGEQGVPDLTKPADRLVLAQLQQAQNLWNAGRALPDGGVGTEGYSFVPRPLDKTIQQMIRPRGGVPNVF